MNANRVPVAISIISEVCVFAMLCAVPINNWSGIGLPQDTTPVPAWISFATFFLAIVYALMILWIRKKRVPANDKNDIGLFVTCTIFTIASVIFAWGGLGLIPYAFIYQAVCYVIALWTALA